MYFLCVRNKSISKRIIKETVVLRLICYYTLKGTMLVLFQGEILSELQKQVS